MVSEISLNKKWCSIGIIKIELKFFGARTKKNGNWEWINGDKIEYKNWYPGQASNSVHPSNGTIQTYGWIHTDWLGKWDDHFDSNDVGTAATHGIAEIPICN